MARISRRTIVSLFLNTERGQRFQPTFNGGLILTPDLRVMTRQEFINTVRAGEVDVRGIPLLPGFREVFLRGEAQTNQVVRSDQSIFGSIRDYRSSLGFELRVQVPVVNVPFRLIYAYNPNARAGEVANFPGFSLNERKSVFRFSVGRTF